MGIAVPGFRSISIVHTIMVNGSFHNSCIKPCGFCNIREAAQIGGRSQNSLIYLPSQYPIQNRCCLSTGQRCIGAEGMILISADPAPLYCRSNGRIITACGTDIGKFTGCGVIHTYQPNYNCHKIRSGNFLIRIQLSAITCQNAP